MAIAAPVDAARPRAGHGEEPTGLLRAPHQLRPRRPADRAARRLLRRASGRWRRSDHHRGALDASHRLAVREADPRLPPRRHPGLPAHHRGGPPPRSADLRPDQPQRWAGLVDVLAIAGVGAVAGRRSPVSRGAEGGHRRRDRRDRRRVRPRRRALRRGRFRRHRAAVLPLVDRPRLPLARHQPAQPTSTVARSRTGPGCCAGSSPPCAATIGTGDGARCAALRRRADRRRHDDRRRPRRRPARRGRRSHRLHQHLDRRRHGEPVHDRGEHARPAGLCDVHPVGDPRCRRPARRRRRSLQGPASGRTRARTTDVRPRRRRAWTDRRRPVRGQVASRRRRRDPPLPLVQPGVCRADGPQPLAGLHREPAHRSRGRAPARRADPPAAVDHRAT